MTGLYLVHLEPRYRHAGHYLGFATDIQRRVGEHHARGRHASPLLVAAQRAGCRLYLARVWPDGDGALERRIKRQGGLANRCPICRAHGLVPASRLKWGA